jgi:hypothetical protein
MDAEKLGLAKVEIDSVFHEMVTFPIQVGDSLFEAMSIHKLPIKYMMNFLETDERSRVPLLLGYLKLCLVNPAEYEAVLELNGEEVLELLDQWMGRSEQAKEIERAKKNGELEIHRFEDGESQWGEEDFESE